MPPSTHREAVLPKLHLDEDYPCSLVGNWNTWYGEQDQAGELPPPSTDGCPPCPCTAVPRGVLLYAVLMGFLPCSHL